MKLYYLALLPSIVFLSMTACSKYEKKSNNENIGKLKNSISIEISNHKININDSYKNKEQTENNTNLKKVQDIQMSDKDYDFDDSIVTRDPILGQGYNSNTEEYLSQCVSDTESEIIYTGQPSSTVHQRTNMSFEELNSVINGRADGTTTFSSFSANGSFEYSSKAQRTKNSVTFTNIINYENNHITILKPYLNKDAYSLINKTTKSVNHISDDVCGNQFVSSLSLGAKLLITVKISLSDSLEAQKISGDLDVTVPAFGSIAGYITALDEKTAKDKSISIFIKQIGGDVSQLAAAIPLDALKCSLEDKNSRESCIRTLKELSNYGTNTFTPSLTKFINDKNNLNGLAVVDVDHSSYNRSPLIYIDDENKSDSIILTNNIPDYVKPFIEQARSELSQWYNFEQNIYIRAKDILSTRANEYQRNQLLEIQKSASENMKRYANAGISCYREMENCLEKKEDARKNAIKYELGILNLITVKPLFNLSGVWQDRNANILLNISQIGIGVDAISSQDENIYSHNYGIYMNSDTAHLDSDNIIEYNDGSNCIYNKKVVFFQKIEINKTILKKFERVYPNNCKIPIINCNLPGEKMYQENCKPSIYEKLLISMDNNYSYKL
ncbi:hypothetical protein [Fluviispira vulneris]|uniref:hypothetical protein n=1 Tax=Fluviispira vulneris TaxID=2763012 RepID=UPI0016441032|nr:hypothetical protein [Fluviispira vulneris]